MGVVIFILTALVFTVLGMMLMTVASSKEIEDAYADGFKLGYEMGKKEEYERVGKLLDKYTEDLERLGG